MTLDTNYCITQNHSGDSLLCDSRIKKITSDHSCYQGTNFWAFQISRIYYHGDIHINNSMSILIY